MVPAEVRRLLVPLWRCFSNRPIVCIGAAGKTRRPAAQEATPEAKPAAADAKPAEPKTAATPGMALAEPPLPPDAHVEQTIQMDGKTLHYTVTVGALPVRDKDGKVAGEVV